MTEEMPARDPLGGNGDRRPVFAAVAVLTLVALALRAVAARQGLFGDELLTFGETRGGLDEVFDGLNRSGAEVTPPLYFILAWASSKLGDPVELIRLPSVLFGAATVPVVWALGRRVAGDAASRPAASLLAVGPFLLFYGSEARAYATVTFFVALSTLALLNGLEGRARAWWFIYALSACAALYTHYTAVFAIGAQAAWALWTHREHLRALVLAHVAIGVGYLPWLPSFLDQRGKGLNIAVAGSNQDPLTPGGFGEPLGKALLGHPYLRLTTLPGEIPLGLVAMAALTVLVVLVLRLARGEATRPALSQPLVLLALVALSTPVGLVAYGVFGSDLYGPRNLSASIPALAAVAAAAVVMARPPRLAALATALLVAASVLGATEFFDPDRVRPAYRAVTRYLDAVAPEGGPIVSSDRDSLNAYFEREHDVYRPGLEDTPAWDRARRGETLYFVGSELLASYAGGRRVAGPGNLFVRRSRRVHRGLVRLVADRYRGIVRGRLERRGGVGIISWTFGSRVVVVPGAARGLVEGIAPFGTELVIRGWATARPRAGDVSWVLAFSGRRLVAVGWAPRERPDVAANHGERALLSGFELQAGTDGTAVEPQDLRVFAVVGARATELPGPAG